jgi:hydroxysqualene synthase
VVTELVPGQNRAHGPTPAAVRVAYRYCERLAQAHYENFPVASRLLPARMRPHIAAIYAFARRADDFADQPGLVDSDRLRLLQAWGARLDRDPARDSHRGSTREPDAEDLIFVALDDTIRTHNLPRTLFHDLLSAFRQDVVTHRYATWTDVLDYCRRSANPVGRLVLRVGGYDDASLDAESDAVCTALQLTNFWQDLAIDWQRGRLYVPAEDLDRAGAHERDLDARCITPEWRMALGAVAGRTRDLFDTGRAIADRVTGRLRWELRLTWLGGRRILDKTEHAGFDVFNRRPSLGTRDALPLVWHAIRWSRSA